MKCANCNCEIGNLTQCPYCGHKNRYIYRAQEVGQYGTVHAGQPYPARPQKSPTISYPQEAPTRTVVPQVQRTPRRVPREIASIEFLLRLILLMQCVIALLLAVELVISSVGV